MLGPSSSSALGSRSSRQMRQTLQPCAQSSVMPRLPLVRSKQALRMPVIVRSSEQEGSSSPPGAVIDNPDSEAAQKKAAADQLRAAEKFMVVGAGNATCKSCGYEYKPENGDPEFPIPKGMRFEALPEEYVCPVCGAPKTKFEARTKVVAGFAANQGYGLGTNAMTGDQKLGLIYGGLLFFFVLFILGYALE